MSDHLIAGAIGVALGVVATVVAAFATRFELLPEVVDLSFVLMGSGLGGLGGAAYAALRRFPPDRLGRVVVLGNLLGAIAAAAVVLAGLLGLVS
jgi:hypothetical protein